MPLPNGSRLSCGATRPRAHLSLNDSSCPPGHNTPLPLERSAPASFKRMLGRWLRCSEVKKGPVAVASSQQRFRFARTPLWLASNPTIPLHHAYDFVCWVQLRTRLMRVGPRRDARQCLRTVLRRVGADWKYLNQRRVLVDREQRVEVGATHARGVRWIYC